MLTCVLPQEVAYNYIQLRYTCFSFGGGDAAGCLDDLRVGNLWVRHASSESSYVRGPCSYVGQVRPFVVILERDLRRHSAVVDFFYLKQSLPKVSLNGVDPEDGVLLDRWCFVRAVGCQPHCIPDAWINAVLGHLQLHLARSDWSAEWNSSPIR